MTRLVFRRHELLACFTLSHLSLPQPLLVCAEPAFLRRSAVRGAGAPAQVLQLRQGKRVSDSIFQARAAAEDQFDVTKSCSAAEYQLCQMVQELEQEKKGHRQLAFDFNNLLTMSTNAETHLKKVCIIPLLFKLTALDLQAFRIAFTCCCRSSRQQTCSLQGCSCSIRSRSLMLRNLSRLVCLMQLMIHSTRCLHKLACCMHTSGVFCAKFLLFYLKQFRSFIHCTAINRTA